MAAVAGVAGIAEPRVCTGIVDKGFDVAEIMVGELVEGRHDGLGAGGCAAPEGFAVIPVCHLLGRTRTVVTIKAKIARLCIRFYRRIKAPGKKRIGAGRSSCRRRFNTGAAGMHFMAMPAVAPAVSGTGHHCAFHPDRAGTVGGEQVGPGQGRGRQEKAEKSSTKGNLSPQFLVV